MSTVSQLGNFPNTIRKLDDKPNLSADSMKQALQADVQTLWNKAIEIINALNLKGEFTGAIYVGNTTPASVAAQLNIGDIYLYVPDLP